MMNTSAGRREQDPAGKVTAFGFDTLGRMTTDDIAVGEWGTEAGALLAGDPGGEPEAATIEKKAAKKKNERVTH